MTEAAENLAEQFLGDRAKLARERDDLDAQLVDISNLSTALQFIVFDLSAESIEPGSNLARLRDSVVGIANAIEARIAAH